MTWKKPSQDETMTQAVQFTEEDAAMLKAIKHALSTGNNVEIRQDTAGNIKTFSVSRVIIEQHRV